MARPDSPSDDESPRTGGAPTAAAFTDTILERMAQQDAVQKATNEQLAAIAAPFAGNSGDPASTVRKQPFDTCRTAGTENTTNTNAAQIQTPGGVGLVTVRELAELKQSFLDMKDRMLEGPTAAPLIERNDERPQSSLAPSTSSPGPAESNLWCSYHKSKAHDTRNFRHLVDALFLSYENRTANVKLPKPRPNNTKSWSKNKEKKAQKNQDKPGTRPKRTEDDKPEERDEDEGEAQVEEGQPRNRRRVQVILARPSPSSDEEEDKQVHDSHKYSNKRPNENVGPEGSNDLRNKLRQKSQTTDRIHDFNDDLRSIIEESKARKVEDSSARSHLTLQKNSGILTDIPTENEILGISRGISEDIPRKHKIWFPHNFLGIYRRNSEEILIRRNILMEYRGKMYSSKKTEEFRGYIIAVREPLESRLGILKIPRKFRRTSRFRRNSVGISSVCR
ncbi:hypothetical protein F2Q70_00036350 [Brassica cretica]|uniref:Uncharacterized protein n=1 Tax=Brassica cretica TaxID=69181 RepID=A0A8S9JY77_BRACR|nr:hypothetical protein F2Q70_00036350 [Brassica cretica]